MADCEGDTSFAVFEADRMRSSGAFGSHVLRMETRPQMETSPRWEHDDVIWMFGWIGSDPSADP